MRVALYIRVSTRGEAQDPTLQLSTLSKWCRAGGHDITGVWQDKASSKDMLRRREWRELLAELDRKRGGVDAVVVTRLTRLAGSTLQSLQIIERLRELRVRLVCVEQPELNLDFDTATGRYTFTVLAAAAQFERELTREMIVEGLNEARERKVKLGRPKGSKDKKKRRVDGYRERYRGRRR